MTKGFFDKVMKVNFAYEPGATGPKGLLTHIQRATLITTSTTPNFALKLFLGSPIKRVFVKLVLKQIGIARREWLNFGNITHSKNVFIVFVAGLPRKPKLPFADWYSTYARSFSKAACSFPTRKSCARLPIVSAIPQNGAIRFV